MNRACFLDMATEGFVRQEKCYSRSAGFADEPRSAHLGSADANSYYHGNMISLEKQSIDSCTSRMRSERSTIRDTSPRQQSTCSITTQSLFCFFTQTAVLLHINKHHSHEHSNHLTTYACSYNSTFPPNVTTH